MSYRPHYSNSWRPSAQRDSWRPSTDDSSLGPDRRWIGTHVRYEEEDDLVFGGRRNLPAGGDSWRPQRREGHTSRPREENNDQVKENSTSHRTFDRPARSRRRQSDRPAPTATAEKSAPLEAQIDPNTFDPASPPLPVHQETSSKDAISAPLRSVRDYARYPTFRTNRYYRSAKSPRVAASRCEGSDRNVPTQGTGSAHRYSLRSGQSNTLSSEKFSGAAFLSHHSQQVSQQDSLRNSGSFKSTPLQHERKQVKSLRVGPPPAPTATDLYLAQARLPLIRCAAPKKLLVVLDLNGTLLVRPNRMRPREFRIRPGVPILLDYLFNSHVVMVYSSARPENVEAMVNALFKEKHAKKIIAIWGRDKLELTPAQYNEKVQVYKKLERVWADAQIQATSVSGQRWSQANTVLVDDSHLKAWT